MKKPTNTQKDLRNEKRRRLTRFQINGNGLILSSETNEDFVLLKRMLGSASSLAPKGKIFRKREQPLSVIERDIRGIQEIYGACRICDNECGVDRKTRLGKCGALYHENIYLAQVEYEEEARISPTYMIYLNGCNMRCSYCHQKDLLKATRGRQYVDYASVVEDIREQSDSIRSISFLGGNPDQSLLTTLEMIREFHRARILKPIVWNSNLTCEPEIMSILNRYVDVFLPDLKFGNDKCAEDIGGLKGYLNSILRNLRNVRSMNPMIIRHLPMPRHFDCCTKPIVGMLKTLKVRYEFSLLESLYEDNTEELKSAFRLASREKVPVIGVL